MIFIIVFALTGCGSVENNYHNNKTIALFLVDEQGFSYGGIPYKCDSMKGWSETMPDGEFVFEQSDTCIFDFLGLEGDYNIHPNVDDTVRIVDYTNEGKGDIPYACDLFGASSTYNDGSFEYDKDDICIFYL